MGSPITTYPMTITVTSIGPPWSRDSNSSSRPSVQTVTPTICSKVATRSSQSSVCKPRHSSKHYRHPVVGDLILGYESFTPIGDPDQTLGLYTVESGSPSEHALSKLAMSAERP